MYDQIDQMTQAVTNSMHVHNGHIVVSSGATKQPTSMLMRLCLHKAQKLRTFQSSTAPGERTKLQTQLHMR